MKLALIGYGAMGQLVAAEARKAGDEVGVVITSKDGELDIDSLIEKLRGHDAVIDFSVGETVLKNVEACARAKVCLVEGTTGWKQHEPKAKQIVDEHSGAMVYGANFSDRRESCFTESSNKLRRYLPRSKAMTRLSRKRTTIANATRLPAPP